MQTSINLQEWFGGIDIYIFDQLLKGRFVPGMGLKFRVPSFEFRRF
jgi:hypothetical protein